MLNRAKTIAALWTLIFCLGINGCSRAKNTNQREQELAVLLSIKEGQPINKAQAEAIARVFCQARLSPEARLSGASEDTGNEWDVSVMNINKDGKPALYFLEPIAVNKKSGQASFDNEHKIGLSDAIAFLRKQP